MCTICSATQTFDPARHGPNAPIFEGTGQSVEATLFETGDAASGPSTSYTMAVGDTFAGTVSFSGDIDWIAITLEAGATYQIDALGSASIGGGSLSDTDITLYSSNGTYLAYDDLNGAGYDAQLVYTTATTGTYYIAVDDYFSSNTGTYNLVVEETVTLPVPGTTGTVEEMAEFLQSGYNNGVEYTFDTSASNVITVNLDGLTAEGKQLARWAMEAWEMVVDIDFQEVSYGSEMITVDDNNLGAYAYFPGGDGPGGVELNVSTGWLKSNGTSLDSYSFQTYIHEFGHAIGLGHQGAYNGSATYGVDETFVSDSWQMSVMSYFSQTENTSTNASFAYVTSAMMADIMAIQDLYGAPGSGSVTAGYTTYGRNSDLGNYMDEIFAGTTSANYDGNVMAFTIYDQGGVDTIDLSFFSSSTNLNVNLNDGTFSDLGTNRIGVLGIAVGTMIENLEAGAGNDTLTGNEANNALTAGDGNDIVFSGLGNDVAKGGSGDDTLYGGTGDDSLSARSGDNKMFGGWGNDTLDGGSDDDLLGGGSGNDNLTGGAGYDTLWGSSGNDVISGGADDDFVGAGDNNDQVMGDGGDDTIYGGGGQDTVDGGTDSDLVAGGAGTDVVIGGSGDDTLWGQAGSDTLSGGNGDDSIAGGSQGDLLQGELGDDTLNGGYGNDTLLGGGDDDVLNGNFGNDFLTGGEGADIFVFDANGAKTVTDFDASEGDMLHIDNALWGGATLSRWQIVNTYADDSSGTVIFDFGGGNTITLQGVSSTSGLAGDLLVI